MTKSLKEILNSAAPPDLTDDEFKAEILRGIIQARSVFDESLSDAAQSTSIITVEPASIAVRIYIDWIRDKVDALCQDEQIAKMFRRALQNECHAIDTACAIIVQNFMPEKCMSRENILDAAGTPRGNGEHAIPSVQSTIMRKNLLKRADEYLAIHNLRIAGPVFGLATTIEERAELDNNMIRILKDCMLNAQNIKKPGDSAPDASQG